jgi:Protein of unknown function (DUF1350)
MSQLMNQQIVALRHGVVAFHPQPKGIVHFIGGYFFGTGVHCWYRRLIKAWQQHFTVHAYSYSFAQLSHWQIASDLLEQIEHVKREGVRFSKQAGSDPGIYEDASKHCLVGHSLGCECISLIRFLGFRKTQQLHILQQARNQLGSKQVTALDFGDIESLPELQPVPYQASLLMAPCYITPTTVSWLLQVRPQQSLVRYLIEHNAPTLLPLTSLISFTGDTIAGSDVSWLRQTLPKHRPLLDDQDIKVNHPGWIPLQYHMIPAFAPLSSGLAEISTQVIQRLLIPHS